MEVILTIVLIYFTFNLLTKLLIRFLNRNKSTSTGKQKKQRQQPSGQPKKKVFTKDDGDYVDFEEIKPEN
jgi:hypothetical protein